MKKYKAVVELGPFEGKKREVKKRVSDLLKPRCFGKTKILEIFSLSVQKSAKSGSMFERKFCRDLSLWFSQGRHDDIFYRSCGSGGRATKKGTSLHQGDVCSFRESGFDLTNLFMIELKGYTTLPIFSFFGCSTGKVAKWWQKLAKSAEKYEKIPWLVLKVRNERCFLNVFPGSFPIPDRVKKVKNDLVCGVFSNDFFRLDPKEFLECARKF